MISPGPALLSRVYFTCSTRHDICPKLHRWIFRPKKFTLLISPNFNSFRDKNTKMSVYGWRNLHRWQKFYTPAGKDGRDKSHLCVQRFSFIFRIRTAGYWVGNCKEVFLQRGDVQFLILPPLVNISHCLETLALGEHFVFILLFRGIINISRIWLILRAVSRTKKNGGKSRQSCTYNLTFWFWSSAFSISIHHAIPKEAVKSFFVFQTPRQKNLTISCMDCQHNTAQNFEHRKLSFLITSKTE